MYCDEFQFFGRRFSDAHALFSAALIVGWIGFSGSAASGQSFTGLGVLPGYGFPFSEGNAVNSDGTVVVGTSGTTGPNESLKRAFRWTPSGGMLSLGSLSGTTDGTYGTAVTTDGSMVAGYGKDPNTRFRAFRWTSGVGMQTLEELAGGHTHDAFGYGLSGNGLVVGFGGTDNGRFAFRCAAPGIAVESIGRLPNGTNAFAYGVSTDGSVVVGYNTILPNGDFRAFRWTPSPGNGNVDLGTLPGGRHSIARSVSGDGNVVVGEADLSTGFYRAFRWTTNEGMQDLATLPGDMRSYARAVNGDGSVIVGVSEIAGVNRAFRWTSNGAMQDLNSYLPSLGIDLTGWMLTEANGISPDGRAVVGTGLHNGQREAWIAKLSISDDVFNMPLGLTSLELLPVGNPGNTGESAAPLATELFGIGGTVGGVSYSYNISKYETTAAQYVQFLNAVAADDVYGLYQTDMATAIAIQRSGIPGGYTYSVAPNFANRPVLMISWADAARFANWLTNGQPSGSQSPATTEDGSYALFGANDETALLSVTRKPGARYVIPTVHEWFKAAYHKNDGVTGIYWDYPTGTDAEPSNDLINPDPGNSANFNDGGFTLGFPFFRSEVGAFENSASPYGTFDQGGNVWELVENWMLPSALVLGGSWATEDLALQAGRYGLVTPLNENGSGVGFRVALINIVDCNQNGVHDANDIANHSSQDCNANTVPDECETAGQSIVLVSAKIDDSIRAYDAGSGALLSTIVPAGTGGLDYPNSHTVAANGDIFVCSAGTSSVLQFSGLNGAFIRSYQSPLLHSPTGIVLREPNQLLVTDFPDDSVIAFNLQTGQSSVFIPTGAGGLDGPGPMLLRPNGALLVSGQASDKVHEYDLNGAFVGIAAEGNGLNGPSGLLFDSSGNLVVSSFQSGQVLKFAADGSFLGTLVSAASGGLTNPEGLAWSPTGTLLVCNRMGGNVLEFDGATGAFIRVFATGNLNEPNYVVTSSKIRDCNANGVPDTCDLDTDGDGVIDACDLCPANAAKVAPGACGCGASESGDGDGDGIQDCIDNCPAGANGSQLDADGDGAGDACDGCPNSPGQTEATPCGCGLAAHYACGIQCAAAGLDAPGLLSYRQDASDTNLLCDGHLASRLFAGHLGCTSACKVWRMTFAPGCTAAQFGSLLSQPESVLIDNNGYWPGPCGAPHLVIVGGRLSTGEDIIYFLNPTTGSVCDSYVDLLGGVGQMALDSFGRLFLGTKTGDSLNMVDGGVVYPFFTAAGQSLRAVCLDAAENVYVTGATDGVLRKLAPDGSVISANVASGLQGAISQAIAPGGIFKGHLFVACGAPANRVIEVDTVTGATSTFIGDLPVNGIAFDPDGFLNLSVPTANQVVRIGPGLPGDMDGSGSVNLADMAGFVKALLRTPDAPLPILTADMNLDGCADGRDVKTFVGVLVGG